MLGREQGLQGAESGEDYMAPGPVLYQAAMGFMSVIVLIFILAMRGRAHEAQQANCGQRQTTRAKFLSHDSPPKSILSRVQSMS